MITFRCPECVKSIKAPRNAVGKPGKCPRCGHSFTVPAVSSRTKPKTDVYFAEFDGASPKPDGAFEDKGWSGSDGETATPTPERIPDATPEIFNRISRHSVARNSRRQRSLLWELLSFRLLIATPLIQAVWIVGAVIFTVIPILGFLGGFYYNIFTLDDANDTWIEVLNETWGEVVIGLISTLILIIVGNLLWRLFCEAVIVFFKMHESLRELVDSSK